GGRGGARNPRRGGAASGGVAGVRASRSMGEPAWGGRARPPVIHSPRPRVHGVLLSPDVDLASATPGPTGLLYLQQVIGNRTVQRLLVARQQGAAEGPLSAAQVLDAIAYYRNKPDRYPSHIIIQIQKAV